MMEILLWTFIHYITIVVNSIYIYIKYDVTKLQNNIKELQLSKNLLFLIALPYPLS